MSVDEPAQAADATDEVQWTFAKGLTRGTVWTAIVSVVVGCLFCLLTYYAPPVSIRGILNVAWGFSITFVLFAVMQRASGMVDDWCNLVVLAFVVLIFIARHVTLFAGIAAQAGVPLLATSILQPFHLAVLNGPPAIGVAFAAYLCKDGDCGLDFILDLLMTNPFTGRRA